jgi:hypothetical protein
MEINTLKVLPAAFIIWAATSEEEYMKLIFRSLLLSATSDAEKHS